MNNRVLNKQVMGDLPEEKLAGAAPFVFTVPFVFTAVNLFGPRKVRELVGGGRLFKYWGVIFSCLATKACCILAYPVYSTAAFSVTYRRFCAIYGKPTRSIPPWALV